jgi:hypothetical protein
MTTIKKCIGTAKYNYIYLEVESDHRGDGGDVEIEQNRNTLQMDFGEAKELANAILKAVEFAETVG